jgi:hypothetical protein
VPIAAEYNNYPLSFLETHTNQWVGIYFDALEEITKITGLAFERANDQTAGHLDIIAMVEKGEALIMPDLFHTKEYEGRFLWSEVPLLSDNFMFISRSDFRNVEADDIYHLRVGLRSDSIYYELFNKMFPDHKNVTEYGTMEELWAALKRGDLDVVLRAGGGCLFTPTTMRKRRIGRI